MSRKHPATPATGVKRLVFLGAGFITLIVGLIGIVVPLLPTTPFLLLSCACFLRSSQRMYRWVHTNKVLGQYIVNYEKGQMLRRDKIISLGLLWVTISLSLWFMPVFWPKILLLVIATGVTWHLTSLKSV